MDDENRIIFFNFYKKMVGEYDKQPLMERDLWKTANLSNFLFGFINGTLQDNTKESIIENPNHLIEIANDCVMVYHRLTCGDKTSELDEFFNYLKKIMLKDDFPIIEKLYQKWKYSLQ